MFCQYTFWGAPEPIVVPPQIDADVSTLQKRKNDGGMAFRFDHRTVSLLGQKNYPYFFRHCFPNFWYVQQPVGAPEINPPTKTDKMAATGGQT